MGSPLVALLPDGIMIELEIEIVATLRKAVWISGKWIQLDQPRGLT